MSCVLCRDACIQELCHQGKNTKWSLFMKLQELASAVTLAILLCILKYKVGVFVIAQFSEANSVCK